jgi:hypothetical protein
MPSRHTQPPELHDALANILAARVGRDAAEQGSHAKE